MGCAHARDFKNTDPHSKSAEDKFFYKEPHSMVVCNNLEVISASVRQTMNIDEGNIDNLFMSMNMEELFKKRMSRKEEVVKESQQTLDTCDNEGNETDVQKLEKR